MANPEVFLSINNEPVTALDVVSSYKYLGLRTGISGSHAEVKGMLSTGLERLKRAPLKPQQRMFMLRVYLIPRLLHQLVLGEVTASTLECLDRTIRKAIRGWLRLPKDTPKPYFHASARDGGLGISSLRQTVPVLRKQRLLKLQKSTDEAIRWVAGTPAYSRHMRKVTRLTQEGGDELVNTLECLKVQAVKLHSTCDGKGLWQCSNYPAISNWVTDGTSLLTGGDYIQAVQVRGNLLPSSERSTRGRREALPFCEAGCNAVCSLGHISQSCVRTHRLRCARHNSLVEFMRSLLVKNGNIVLVEPIIVTRHGNRKPDIVSINSDECHILDVTISADVFDMAKAYQQKVSYYQDEDILHWAASEWPGKLISVDAIVMNWRGAVYHRSASLLRYLGLKDSDMRILAVRILTYTSSMFRHYSKSTTRVKL